jgi:zinc/manganese transport system substrate-binding protein
VRVGSCPACSAWSWAGPLMAAVVGALVLAACASGSEPDVMGAGEEDPSAPVSEVTLVATTSILGDIVASIVGDGAEIEVLMPPGTDPHHFEASPAQARLLREADLVVANGLELEVQLDGVLASAEQEGANVIYVGEHADALPWNEDDDGHGHGDDDGHGHGDDDGHDHADDDRDHGEYDPHFWFDPVRAAEGVRALGERLAEIGGDLGEGWADSAYAYAEQLLALDEALETVLADVPDERRLLVTNHHTLGYLAERYAFEVVGTVMPDTATLGEPGAQQLRALAELIDELDVPAIFADTTAPTRLAEAIAQEAEREVEVVALHTESLGEPGSGAETYPDMLRTAAERIAEALTG